ncbi:hypothetical protein QEH56_09600 [Pelagicoccus enzymogenes]|uniref:hypothetical protein n=1 Tax=Pelagicoccus enzymogenes TaxID=2773457 RepID=UPI00280D81E5|nr:hypothetical protein [Pelagicoccus enzymogenes]MDQ8198402.1 hypothetical protein [Pelagicoccus enzymogenes]
MLTKTSSGTLMRISRLSRVAGFTAATLALLAGSARAKSLKDLEMERVASEPESELAAVRRQLLEIDQRIDAVEKQAMLHAGPKAAEADYVEELKKAAIEKSPAIEDKFERQDELIEALSGNPQLRMAPEERSPEFVEKLDEFKGLRNEINPVVQSVSSDPAVRESYQEFQDTVLARMKELEPETADLLAQRAELAERFEALSDQPM